MKTIGYAAYSPDTPLAPLTFERRALRPDDVAMEILYCGVCHSDLHVTTGAWDVPAPVVLGHEGSGVVTAVSPSGEPLGFTGYAAAGLPAPST